MKALRSNQHGIGHVVVLVALVVVAAAGFASWRVMNATKAADTAAVQTAGTTPTALKTKADVTKAANELDATSVDSTVNPDSLDSDINSLL